MAAAGLARCLFRRSFPTTLPSWLLDRKDRPCCFRYYRAAICRKLKVPLAIEEVPVRPIQPDEVRVDVHFCGVNFADILTCRGLYQEKPSLPFIPGLELAGQVLEIGTNVSTVKKKLWQIPDGISYQEAAALPVCYGTALLALEQRAQTQPGETVLVTAAAGATGLALIDVASNILQAKVIAAAGSDEKCKLALQRGAKAAVNYSQSNLKEELKSLTGGQGVNVVIDAVGGNVCLTALRSLAWEGRMVVIGFTGGEIMSIPSNLLLVKNVSAMGVYWTRYQQENFPVFSRCMSLALQYCQEGSIRPYIGGVFKLEEINDAFESVTQRKTTGKVLLSVK
ncbi:quinone oxidoreductase-like protein 2 isoform X2 [Petaurus breviceps papuanus]|uniref:quinone oxidoreductase-like protein 2 isoform X2 n=1 Tax=Petaurus breviceps papuanus TaxID=3040969 RepID=UPI0036D8EFE5